jgi:hypothetical protein
MMQRDNELGRVVVDGRRTDDGDRCTLVAVHERSGGCWAFYPHGFGKFGVPTFGCHSGDCRYLRIA